MALPVAHAAAGIGFANSRNPRQLLSLAVIAIAPDLDFILVWGFGLPIATYHRTFSHSLLFAVLAGLVFRWLVPPRCRILPAKLVFLALLSHSLVDMACTANAADHGVMWFWPFSQSRFGWAVLVPLYAYFAKSPFSVEGALKFTLLEVVLAPIYWGGAALLVLPIRRTRSKGRKR